MSYACETDSHEYQTEHKPRSKPCPYVAGSPKHDLAESVRRRQGDGRVGQHVRPAVSRREHASSHGQQQVRLPLQRQAAATRRDQLQGAPPLPAEAT